MKLNRLFVAGVVSSWALVGCSPQVKNKNEPAVDSQIKINGDGIIGGTDINAEDKMVDSIVAVYDQYTGQLCTGSLLPNNLVITAAHCIGPFTEAMFVFFDVKIDKDSPRLPVDKVEISPYWETRQSENKNTGDIALLHFQGTAPARYKPATFLPTAAQKLLVPGTAVMLAGFGISNGVEQTGAGILRVTSVKIWDHKYSASEIALDQTQGTGACHGDSGGPAYVQLGGKLYLWGVTSRGVDDAANDCSKYAAYTNALFYKTWLNRMANKLSASLVNPETSR